MLLEYIVSQRGIKANLEKVSAITKMAYSRHQGRTESNRLSGDAEPFHLEVGGKSDAIVPAPKES